MGTDMNFLFSFFFSEEMGWESRLLIWNLRFYSEILRVRSLGWDRFLRIIDGSRSMGLERLWFLDSLASSYRSQWDIWLPFRSQWISFLFLIGLLD